MEGLALGQGRNHSTAAGRLALGAGGVKSMSLGNLSFKRRAPGWGRGPVVAADQSCGHSVVLWQVSAMRP